MALMIWAHRRGYWPNPRATVNAQAAEKFRQKGKSEEYIQKMERLRNLEIDLSAHRMGMFFAWVAAIICLFVFWPIGLFITVITVVSAIREGNRERAKAREVESTLKYAREHWTPVTPKKWWGSL